MAKRSRMTELEAHATQGRQSEPLGSRGKGTLLLERKASGSIMAYYRERSEQSDKRLQLGILSKKPTPDTSERTLSELRTEALKISAEVEAAGSLEKYLALKAADEIARHEKQAKHERESAELSKRGTFGELLDNYIAHLQQANKASEYKVRSLFRVNVHDSRPDLAAKFADEVTPEDLVELLKGVLLRKPKARGIGHKAKAPDSNMRSTTDELRRYLKTAFNHAAGAHLSVDTRISSNKKFTISSNPAALIPAINDASGGNTESLTPRELGELLRHLDTLPKRKSAIAKALIYLGGQRIKQLVTVTWNDINDTSISLLDAKGQKAEAWEHLLPLTPRIQEILQPLITDKMGPGPFSLTDNNVIHPDTAAKIFADASQHLVKAGKTEAFTWQRIRATVESLMAANGVSPQLRAWILSHGRSGIQGKHYDRFAYMPEKTAALSMWGKYLDDLADNQCSVGQDTILSKRRRTNTPTPSRA